MSISKTAALALLAAVAVACVAGLSPTAASQGGAADHPIRDPEGLAKWWLEELSERIRDHGRRAFEAAPDLTLDEAEKITGVAIPTELPGGLELGVIKEVRGVLRGVSLFYYNGSEAEQDFHSAVVVARITFDEKERTLEEIELFAEETNGALTQLGGLAAIAYEGKDKIKFAIYFNYELVWEGEFDFYVPPSVKFWRGKLFYEVSGRGLSLGELMEVAEAFTK